ncbi:MAG: outer membrane beta-barrel protein [Bacteroidales bacterium]
MRIKLLITAIFFIFTVAMAQAQQFNGGLLAGVAAAEISGDRLEGPNKPGIYAGAFVNRYITQRSSFQMELNFVQKGSRKNPDTLDYSSYLLRLNYVELFLHYKWDFGEIFTLEAGPSLGVLVNKYEEADYMVLEDPEFQSTDLSANIGLFVTITDRWRFNLRYSNSVLAVRPHSRGQTYRWNKGQYNEVLSFTFHYQL